ncbi:MAG: chromate transporter [Lachnospiraceae bacterium]|nr:chromate transporter [Candidatus Minthocola equi]
MKDKPGLFELYITFFKIGSITFGGGYAMLPILEREIVQKKGWIDSDEILDYYAVGQSLPGLIAVNVATLTGYKKRGVIGGICASLGVISPCIVIITLIAALLSGFRDNPTVKHAISGITICVAALIVSSVVSLWKKGVTDWIQALIFAASLLIILLFDPTPIVCVLGALLVGILSDIIIRRRKS